MTTIDRSVIIGSMMVGDSEARLRPALHSNAEFSGVGGVAIAAAKPIARLLGIALQPAVVITCMALIGFAVALLALARADGPPLRRGASFVSAADLTWVPASAGVVAGKARESMRGLVAAVVAGFAALNLRLRTKWLSYEDA